MGRWGASEHEGIIDPTTTHSSLSPARGRRPSRANGHAGSPITPPSASASWRWDGGADGGSHGHHHRRRASTHAPGPPGEGPLPPPPRPARGRPARPVASSRP